jgi:hypothetical protein
MDDFVSGDLRINAVGINAVDPAPPGVARYDWGGRSNDRQPGKLLGPYFGRVLDDAQERKAAVEMHFEKLEHFNSSTITAFIQLIQDARQRAITLVFVYNQALKWQRLSFDALRVFVKGDGLLDLKAV